MTSHSEKVYMTRNGNSNFQYKSTLNKEIHIYIIHFNINLDLHEKRKKTDVMIHSYRRQHQNVYNTKKKHAEMKWKIKRE